MENIECVSVVHPRVPYQLLVILKEGTKIFGPGVLVFMSMPSNTCTDHF